MAAPVRYHTHVPRLPRQELRRAMTQTSERLTRRQLYDLVWKTPIDALAPKFGLSGRGLGKLCERNAIPTPPRGYWARKQAGQKVPKPPLLEFERPNGGDPIVLSWRAALLRTPAPADANPWPAFYAEQCILIGPIAVSARLTDPHPAIARWFTSDSSYATPLTRRRARILNALYKALERYRFRIEAGRYDRDTRITQASESFEIDVYEHVAQKRRELTSEERARRYGSQKYAFDKTDTGLLTLRIKSYTPTGVPDRWDETAEAPLETHLHEAVAALIARAAQLAQIREERAEAERQRWAREQEAARREETRQQEIAKHRALVQRARAWREAQDIRAYVAAVETATPASTEFAEWKAWALARAAALDPIVAGDAMATSVRPDAPGI